MGYPWSQNGCTQAQGNVMAVKFLKCKQGSKIGLVGQDFADVLDNIKHQVSLFLFLARLESAYCNKSCLNFKKSHITKLITHCCPHCVVNFYWIRSSEIEEKHN